jgi:hypothetical protein
MAFVMLQCGYRLWRGGNIAGTFGPGPTLTQPCRDLAIPFTEIEGCPSCCDISCFFNRIG